MKLSLFRTLKMGFVLGIVSALLSLAFYSSLTSPKNGLSRTLYNLSMELTEEEEERTVREIPETVFFVDHVATAKLNEKVNVFNFPIHILLSAQHYQQSLRKPPRLS